MKKLFIICAQIILLNVCYAQYDSLLVDDNWRTFLTHLPPQYNSGQNAPYSLILALHGGLGNAYNLEKQSMLSEKIDAAGLPFIVVYPEGAAGPNGYRTWNAGNCCGFAHEEDMDDVKFISVLLDTLLSRYSITPKKVYLTGMSNGGMMIYRLAAQLSRDIAAIAPVACTSMLWEQWTPIRPIPIIHFHSFADERIPFYGGYGTGFTSNIYKPPVDSVLNVWAELNGCSSVSDTLFHENGEYLYLHWPPDSSGAEIQLYVTYDGGHSWPGGAKGTVMGDSPSPKINASDLMCEFFQNHSIKESTGIQSTIAVPERILLLQNFPNPFNPQTRIRYKLITAGVVNLTVYDLHGNEVEVLVNQCQSAGEHCVTFQATNHASGVYVYRIHSQDFVKAKKMILIR